VMNQYLNPSPHFLIFKNLIERQHRDNTLLPDLTECISHLRHLNLEILKLAANSNQNQSSSLSSSSSSSDRGGDDEEYWRAVCRYVIPLIGATIEQGVFTLDHLQELDDMGFYYDPKGDFEAGLTLFHYACKSANLSLVQDLYPKTCNNVNQCTSVPSGSAAIHFAISSLKHPSNTNGMKGSMALLDYLILSLHANINLQDSKGETALFKAAMEGSYQIVVHLLNYPQPVDIHILSKCDQVSAIVAAARYSPQIGENGDLCIKALLQMGSEYSPSLRALRVVSNDELIRIRKVARQLIDDPNSAYARYPHATLALRSWID
jgi:hypothetical protein